MHVCGYKLKIVIVSTIDKTPKVLFALPICTDNKDVKNYIAISRSCFGGGYLIMVA